MKNLFKLMIAGGFLLFCTISLQAQEPQEKLTAAQRASKVTDKLKKDLNLTEEQANKVLEVNKDFFSKMEAQRALNKENRRTSRDEMKKNDEDQDKRMKEILTAEQYKSYLDLKEKRRNDERHERGKRPEDRSGRHERTESN